MEQMMSSPILELVQKMRMNWLGWLEKSANPHISTLFLAPAKQTTDF